MFTCIYSTYLYTCAVENSTKQKNKFPFSRRSLFYESGDKQKLKLTTKPVANGVQKTSVIIILLMYIFYW